MATIAAMLLHIAPTSAAPVIRVKARTIIKLEPILRSGSRIIIRGRISDRSSDAAITGVRVWAYFDRARRTSLSDDNGKFDMRFVAGIGKHDLTVSFSGDAHHSPSSVELRSFDASKNPLTLTLELPTEVPYPPKNLQARLTAKSDGSPVRLPITVTIAESASPTRKLPKHVLPSVTTNAKGDATIRLPAKKIGKPGRKVVELRFAGDDSYDAATARGEFLLTTATALTANLDDDRISFESTALVKGKLVNNTNSGVALASIVLLVNGKRLGQTITSNDGSYELGVSAKLMGAGDHMLDVRFEASRSWRKSSAAKPLSITIGEPEPLPVGYTIAAFGATALVLLAFVGMRAKPWQNWAWLTKLRHQDAEPEPPTNHEKPPVLTGLQPARPGLVSTLRRASDANFSGIVRDAVSGRLLDGAQIEMIHTGDHAAAATTGADGAFEFDGLAHGHWRATVHCHGYCGERFGVSIPHRGEMTGVRVEMLPVRERIFEMYRTAAGPLLPDAKQWGIWTPRQIVDHVRGQRPESTRPALAALTDFVEETYFSQRAPAESILDHAQQLVQAARSESGR